jgi:hypothetical protein
MMGGGCYEITAHRVYQEENHDFFKKGLCKKRMRSFWRDDCTLISNLQS